MCSAKLFVFIDVFSFCRSRTFQFYEMGKKTGATTTIKKSHSKKSPVSNNEEYELEDVDHADYYNDEQ